MRWMLTLQMIGVGCLAGCDNGGDGCTTSEDCLGDRLCEVATGECVDPGGNGGNGGRQDAGPGGPGGGSGGVQTCNALCDLSPAAAGRADCVSDFVSARHPQTVGIAACQQANDGPAICNTCYGEAQVPDATCAAAHTECFGSGVGGQGGGGPGGQGGGGPGGQGGGGPGGAGGGGDGVSTCSDLCDFAPVDDDTADCVSRYMVARYPATAAIPTCAQANSSPAVCLACYGQASISDADCRSAHAECF